MVQKYFFFLKYSTILLLIDSINLKYNFLAFYNINHPRQIGLTRKRDARLIEFYRHQNFSLKLTFEIWSKNFFDQKIKILDKFKPHNNLGVSWLDHVKTHLQAKKGRKWDRSQHLRSRVNWWFNPQGLTFLISQIKRYYTIWSILAKNIKIFRQYIIVKY